MLTMCRGQIVFRRSNFGIGTGALQQASRLEGILGNENGE
jgi:dihydroorotase